ncbi:MAG: hypothetical protein ACP5SI_11005, partial [Chloroflexia bacterium]
MKHRTVRKGLTGTAVLVVLLLGWGQLLALASPRGQGPTVSEGRLGFGDAQGSIPTLSLLAADASRIDLRAALPGCQ